MTTALRRIWDRPRPHRAQPVEVKTGPVAVVMTPAMAQ